MGGELEFDSEFGVGTTVSFTLTFETKETTEAEQAQARMNQVKRPMFKGEVLVCEDNPMNQRVIADHLKRVGLDAKIVENGREGIDCVKDRIEKGQKPFDLILMDIHMPVMDGIEATPKIIKLGTGTPIVAITANIMADDRGKYKSLGMSDCIGKPFTSQELWQCLIRYIKPVGTTAVATKEIVSDELQNQLKTDFVMSNQTKMHEITSAIAAGDITLAHRLVHTLKSNAGYVGKISLQKIAADVEASLKSGENQTTAEQMNALRFNLTKALDDLAPYMDEISDENQSEETICDIEKARELIDELEPLLRSGNPKCLKLIDDLRKVPGSGEVIRQMKDYYFGAAAKLLTEVKNNLISA